MVWVPVRMGLDFGRAIPELTTVDLVYSVTKAIELRESAPAVEHDQDDKAGPGESR